MEVHDAAYLLSELKYYEMLQTKPKLKELKYDIISDYAPMGKYVERDNTPRRIGICVNCGFYGYVINGYCDKHRRNLFYGLRTEDAIALWRETQKNVRKPPRGTNT